jgi:proteic killer suppression protein
MGSPATTASEVEDMNLPGFRFHALIGRDKSRYAVTASGNWRITFGWLEGDAIDVAPRPAAWPSRGRPV